MKGASAVLQHKVGLAMGSYNVVLRAIVATTQKVASLDEMLFQRSLDDSLLTSSGRSSGSTGPPAIEIAPALGSWLADENLYAQKAWEYMTSLMKYRAAAHLHYTSDLPECLAKLPHEDPAVRNECLQFVKEVWEALWACEERAAAGEEECRKLMRAMMWPYMPGVRELVLGLASFKFLWVPPPVELMLLSCFGGYGQSAILENVG